MARRDQRFLEKGNPRAYGTASITIPAGPTTDEPTPVNGMLRYDTTTNKLRAVVAGVWADVGGGGGGATALNDLTDVTITAVADDEILQYNSGTGQWENVDPDLLFPGPESLTFAYTGDQLTDVTGATTDIDITYNMDGSINTVVDNNESTTITLGYNAGGQITSTTVT